MRPNANDFSMKMKKVFLRGRGKIKGVLKNILPMLNRL